jgi:hypothetical protein
MRIYLIRLPDGQYVSSPTNTTTASMAHAASFRADDVKAIHQAQFIANRLGGELVMFEYKNHRMTEVK